MKTFDYVRPATIADAIAAAAEPGAAYLAAGTNLLDLMKGGITHPNRLVDVTRLPALDRIEHLPDGGIRIGALVRNADLAHDPISPGPIPRLPRRFCPAPRRSFAMPRPSAAICCSGRDVDISTTPPAPATNARRARVAMPAAARTDCTPCSAGATPASHPSVGFLRAACRPRRRRGDRGQNRPARGCGRGPSLPARRHASARKRPRAGVT